MWLAASLLLLPVQTALPEYSLILTFLYAQKVMIILGLETIVQATRFNLTTQYRERLWSIW